MIDAIIGGAPFSSEWIDFGRTPAVLRMLGARDLPLKLDPKKLNDAVKPGRKYSLSADDVVGALEHIGDPVAVFASRTQPGALVVVTEVLSAGRPMFIAVHLDGSGNVNAINKVASVYAKDNAQGFFELNDAEGNLRYINKEKRQAFEQAAGLQLPLSAPAQPGVIPTVMDDADLVKFESDDRMASRAFSLNDYAQSREGRSAIRERLGAVFDAAFSGDSVKTFNWWNRSFGSQFHKAKKSREFAKVYDIANAFLDDVSRFANRAADRARGILPHLDSLKDIGRGLNVRQAWADAKDYAAIAPAVFEGTLVNGNTGKVWTDHELRDRYNLTGVPSRLLVASIAAARTR